MLLFRSDQRLTPQGGIPCLYRMRLASASVTPIFAGVSLSGVSPKSAISAGVQIWRGRGVRRMRLPLHRRPPVSAVAAAVGIIRLHLGARLPAVRAGRAGDTNRLGRHSAAPFFLGGYRHYVSGRHGNRLSLWPRFSTAMQRAVIHDFPQPCRLGGAVFMHRAYSNQIPRLL